MPKKAYWYNSRGRPCARYLGHYRGKKVQLYPYTVTISPGILDTRTYAGKLAATSTREVAEALKIEWAGRIFRGEIPHTPVEIEVYGPKGGEYRFSMGWESLVFYQMDWGKDNPHLVPPTPQLKLTYQEE
jgi:hypothetical protein